jgi:dimethylamine/trimethylamine dehydrogenase
LAGVIADHLSSDGHAITFVTPASVVSPWTVSTLEQTRVQQSLLKQKVKIIANKTIALAKGNSLESRCVFTGDKKNIVCKTLILVTERSPNDTLYNQLIKEEEGSRHIQLIGDAEAPGLIADAIFSGHLAAENFESSEEEIERAIFMREMPQLKQN